jgi:hypothetical protein
MAKPKAQSAVAHATDGLGNPSFLKPGEILTSGQNVTFNPRDNRPLSDLSDDQLREMGKLLIGAQTGYPRSNEDPLVTLRLAYNHEAGLRFMEDAQ